MTAAVAWEPIRLRGVGVDIGSATSHVVFSEITMAKVGARYVPVDRRVTYRSPIRFTPYLAGSAIGPAGSAIDVESLLEFIDEQFAAAGARRADIDCGAVILTGTALDRRNARLAADLFAAESGRFVTVSAGDELEAVLAAHGSGAVGASLTLDGALLGIDVGGGTTKLAVCVAGRVVATTAIDVGTRLIVVDEAGAVVRLEDAAVRIAERAGVRLALGAPVAPGDLEAIVAFMVGEIWAAATVGSVLARTAPLPAGITTAAVMVSGGIAEYFGYAEAGAAEYFGDAEAGAAEYFGDAEAGTAEYVGDAEAGTAEYVGTEAGTAGGLRFGDLGEMIAHELRRRLRHEGIVVRPAAAGIRATVLGAALFTVQLSGDTIYLPDPGVVPLRDVPVVVPDCTPDDDEPEIAAALARVLGRAGVTGALAVAVRWRGSATRERLSRFARGLVAGLREPAGGGSWAGPLVLLCADDVGRLLGRRVAALLPDCPIVSLDGVDVRDLDFVDIAAPVDGAGPVPVTVKSLVFAEPS